MKRTSKPPARGPRTAEQEKLDNVIRYLLNQHSFLHEKRIQKLVFLADLQMLQTTGKRMVEADFKPFYHGVYSDDVLLSLQSMPDLKTGPDTAPDGRETVVFLREKRPYSVKGLTTDEKAVLDEIVSTYGRMSTDELAAIGKSTLLWESSDFGEPFDYAAYRSDPAMRVTPRMAKAFASTERLMAARKLKEYDTVEAMWADSG